MNDDSSDPRFDEIIAEFLPAREAGAGLDQDELIAQATLPGDSPAPRIDEATIRRTAKSCP